MGKAICIAMVIALLSACGSTRKSTESISVKSDSTTANTNTRLRDSISYSKTRIVKDSVIAIAARQVKDTLELTDLQPAYTIDGNAVKRSYTADTKGAHAFLNVLPNGQVEYGCNADSLNIVVQSLIRENTELQARYDSVHATDKFTSQNNSTVQHSSVLRTRSFMAAAWPYILVLVVVVLAAFIAKRVLKWPL